MYVKGMYVKYVCLENRINILFINSDSIVRKYKILLLSKWNRFLHRIKVDYFIKMSNE